MKTRTKKSELQNLLYTISKLSGISTEKKDGEKYNLYLEFAACYGGYHEQNEQGQDAKSHPKKPIWGMGEKK